MMESMRKKRTRSRPPDRRRPRRHCWPSIREAFGPETGYWRGNTAAETLADWREYRAAEPGLTLRGYARLLLSHEVQRWGTPPWPLMHGSPPSSAVTTSGPRGRPVADRPGLRPAVDGARPDS